LLDVGRHDAAQNAAALAISPQEHTMSLTDTIKGVIGMDPTEHADADIKSVLAVLRQLGGKPIETCTVAEARMQPTPADAVKQFAAQRHSAGAPAAPRAAVMTQDMLIPGAQGHNPARLYTPAGAGPFPVILYFHGGGFVIADLDTYDAAPRALAAQANAVVLSVHYRRAPEHKFPAAHLDAGAAWVWLIENCATLNGDPARMAVMGESAGANLAINVAIQARDQGLLMPVHQTLVYPVASNNTLSLSYEENRNARPLNKAMMLWFVEQLVNDKAELKDPRIDVVSAELARLPPAAIVTAGIDPLRSDGETLADKLRAAGVAVQHRHYAGATHEFFGMAEVVQAARDAQAFVAASLRECFAQRAPRSGA
jgi:acetyl esterase